MSYRVIAFTGQGERSRTDYAMLAERAGLAVHGSIDDTIDLLVAGEGTSNRKLTIAAGLGIPVLSYEEWERTLPSNLIAPRLQVHVPGSYPDDRPASESLRSAVEDCYRDSSFDQLTDGQAKALLDYRSFALAVLDGRKLDLRRVEAQPILEPVAVAISERRNVAEGAVAFMREFVARGSDWDRLPTAVKRAEFFDFVDAAVEDQLARQAGYISGLRSASAGSR